MPLAARRPRRVAWRLRLGLTLVALLALAACHRDHDDAPSKSGALPAATAASPAPAPALGTDAIVGVVQAWSDALNRHDILALGALYSNRIIFYGTDAPKAAVLKTKRDALGSSKGYTQQIASAIAVTPGEHAGEFVARFLKRSGPTGRQRETRARLGLRIGDSGAPLITEEADDMSAPVGHLDAGASGAAECEARTAEVVNAIPAVKKALDDAKKDVDQSKGRSRFGGMGPNEDDEHTFSASLGVFTDQNFQELVSYTVNHGHLSLFIMGAGERVPPEALRAVEQACR